MPTSVSDDASVTTAIDAPKARRVIRVNFEFME